MDLGQYLLISFEFWSAIFCIITALCVFLTRKYDQRSAVCLRGMLTVNAVLNAADALAYYYRGDGSQFGYYMVRITNFTVLYLPGDREEQRNQLQEAAAYRGRIHYHRHRVTGSVEVFRLLLYL